MGGIIFFQRSDCLLYTSQGLLITFYFLLNIIAYLNGLVFQLYKFHINGLVLDMVFGQDAGQVFNFETSLILRFALTILAVGFLFSGIIWIAYRFYQRLRRRQIILYLVLFVCSTLSAHLVHAYACLLYTSIISIPFG